MAGIPRLSHRNEMALPQEESGWGSVQLTLQSCTS